MNRKTVRELLFPSVHLNGQFEPSLNKHCNLYYTNLATVDLCLHTTILQSIE